MSYCDPYTFLKTLIAKEEAETQRHGTSAAREPLIVTLAMDYGSTGELIAAKLADCLGIPVYDREILECLARKARIETFKLEPHDENVSAGVATFLYSLLTGTGGDLHTYRRSLYETVLELAQRDALLVGRGAHLILSGKKVFRLRVVGSKLVCARRVAEETGMPVLEAERLVYEVNNKRHKAIDKLFSDSYEHCSLEMAKNFDLIINTDHVSAENAVPIILVAMQQMGFDLRNTVKRS